MNKDNSLLDRIGDVYGQSQQYLPLNIAVESKLADINHLYNLHFNPYTPRSLFGRLMKQLFQQITRPLFSKQVAYNAAVRDVLVQTTLAISNLEREVKEIASHQLTAPGTIPSE